VTFFPRLCLALTLPLAALASHAADGAPPLPEAAASSPGATVASAIEVCRPIGEREYLSRLVCSSGEPAQFKRLGSLGPRNKMPELSEAEQRDYLRKMMASAPLEPGEVDYHIIDSYEVVCGGVKHTLYLDMYHCRQPVSSTPPAGFTLRQP